MTRSDWQHPIGDELYERAKRVIPGGIYGHQSPVYLVDGAFPRFLCEAEGCRVRDADGHEYVDFLCSYGPMVLGYRDAVVEAAAERQRRLCDSGNLPAPNMVELAEKLVSITAGADWAMFAKNGSDVCTWALAVARRATRRDLVAMVEGTYHGVHGWCNPARRGFPDGERSGIVTFPWNDAGALEELFRKYDGRIAGVIATPFRHEARHDSVMPGEGFLQAIRELSTRHSAVMISDDVRAGFRLSLAGSMHHFGVTPDMTVYSKAIANGYPLSVMLGSDALRKAAEDVFVTGTFFTQAVPIAAAIATIGEIEKRSAIEHMDRVGRRLCGGLTARARAAGLAVTISGPPSIPFLSFVADEGRLERSRTFAAVAASHGAFFHPAHNWFVSAAHQDADIDFALDAAEAAMAAVAREHGKDAR
ncbi:MAG TPA: aminotransferase class III-fold pyridoxal phosphate-dependent enzyme [Candidatus Limnocylindrales bacterium]|nr:aminotransferase class III-fold pyridoxal phosphate-dependent enzyme [Candidatus Limnocylindrales bacterium]